MRMIRSYIKLLYFIFMMLTGVVAMTQAFLLGVWKPVSDDTTEKQMPFPLPLIHISEKEIIFDMPSIQISCNYYYNHGSPTNSLTSIQCHTFRVLQSPPFVSFPRLLMYQRLVQHGLSITFMGHNSSDPDVQLRWKLHTQTGELRMKKLNHSK